jgi:mono/diheme cytochrome c family protein
MKNMSGAKTATSCLVIASMLAWMNAPAAVAAGNTAADPARGQLLYEKHCGACHTPGIHYRRDTLPVSRDELLGLVDLFRRQAGLAWTPEEINDVTEYLNRTRYHFPKN